MSKFYYYFETPTIFINDVVNGKSIIPNHERLSRIDNSGWAGCSFDEAVKRFKVGTNPKELKAKAKEHLDDFKEFLPRQNYEQDLVPDFCGGSVNIDRFLNEDPRCLNRFKDTTESVTSGLKLQRLILNTCVNASVSHNTKLIAGIIMLAVINALELLGTRVELIIRTSIINKLGDILTYDLRIKNYDQTPDYSLINYTIADNSFLRKLIFSLMEQENPELIKLFDINRTNSNAYTDKTKLEETDLVLPIITYDISLEEYKQKVIQLLRNQYEINT